MSLTEPTLEDVQATIAVHERRLKANREEQRILTEEYEGRMRVLRDEWRDLYDNARYRELRRLAERLDPKGPRCNKCGNYYNNPGGMVSDDSYSRFRCPFHKVSTPEELADE